jgi:hypothetical protein
MYSLRGFDPMHGSFELDSSQNLEKHENGGEKLT